MNTTISPYLLETSSDELERLVLEEVHKRRRIDDSVSALVLPAGREELAIGLARLGCQVTGVDEPCYQDDFRESALAAGKADEMAFAPGSIHALPDSFPGAPFDVAYIRRGLCNLPYGEACQVVRKLLRQLKIGGKLYVSVLGVHSELGDHYAGAELPIEDRFCPLDDGMAQKYGIEQPICLYSERNLFMLLLKGGGSVLRTFTSTHGNVKAIAVRV